MLPEKPKAPRIIDRAQRLQQLNPRAIGVCGRGNWQLANRPDRLRSAPVSSEGARRCAINEGRETIATSHVEYTASGTFSCDLLKASVGVSFEHCHCKTSANRRFRFSAAQNRWQPSPSIADCTKQVATVNLKHFLHEIDGCHLFYSGPMKVISKCHAKRQLRTS